MNAIVQQLVRYLQQTLGAEVLVAPWRAAVQPILGTRYEFMTGNLFGSEILFAVDTGEVEETPGNIRRQIELLRPKARFPIVYVRAGVTAYNRRRLIEQRVSFVIPGNQMFLPHLGIDLREHFSKKEAERTKLRPATQAILIHALLRNGEGRLAAGEIPDEFGYSAMTLSRAFDEIVQAGLAESVKKGRERILHLKGARREVWRMAQDFLSSPVKARHYIRPAEAALYLRAGQSALALYSAIAEPHNTVVAVSREDWARLRRENAVELIPEREEGVLEMEVWNYQPRPHQQPFVVDPLSLYLSMRDMKDERIESALEEMLEKLSW